MQVLIVESAAAVKAVLRGRVSEGLRQADIRGLEVAEAPEAALQAQAWGTICGVLIGPSAHASIDQTVERVRKLFPQGPLGVVLTEEPYQKDALAITKRLNVRVYSMAELTGLATFLIECGKQLSLIASRKNENIFGVCQFKGGVGTTSIAVALAACWARHGIKTALVDLDDVNPQITSWARVGLSRRTVTAEHLALGHLPESRVADIAAPVETFEGKLSVIGQPDTYNEGFHFKANVIDNAPSSSEFMHSLISALKGSFDAVILDLSRSWGLSTFAALPRCQRVLLVTDEDRLSLRRTLESLRRMRKESDDPEEFDLSRWSIVVTGYTGEKLTETDIRTLIDESEMLGAATSVLTVPYTESGREWGDPGVSLYDCADAETRSAIEQIAYDLIPFQRKESETASSETPQIGALSALLGRFKRK